MADLTYYQRLHERNILISLPLEDLKKRCKEVCGIDVFDLYGDEKTQKEKAIEFILEAKFGKENK